MADTLQMDKTVDGTPPATLLPRLKHNNKWIDDGAWRLVKQISPQKMAIIFQGAKTNIALQMQLYEMMEETDAHLSATLSLRRLAVQKMDKIVKPGDADDKISCLAADAAREFVNSTMHHNISDHLLRAFFWQYSAVNLAWGYKNGLLMPVDFLPVPGTRFWVDPDLNFSFFVEDHWSVRTPCLPGAFILHQHSAVKGRPGSFGIGRALALLWFYNKVNINRMGQMIESYNTPIIKVGYDEQVHIKDLEEFIQNMLDLASEKVVVYKKGTDVDIMESPTTNPHRDVDEWYRRYVSIIILGQDAAQMGRKPNELGVTEAAAVRDDIRDADAKALDSTENEWLWKVWSEWNFGPEIAPPKVIRQPIKERKDVNQAINSIKAMKELGLPVKTENIYSSLDWEMPDGVDEIYNDQMNINQRQQLSAKLRGKK